LVQLGVPFRITKNQALQRFKSWIQSGLINSPLDLPTSNDDIRIEAKYCPCFEFKITANTNYSVKLTLVNNGVHSCQGDHGDNYDVVVYASEELQLPFRQVLQGTKIDVMQDEDLSDRIRNEGIQTLHRTIAKEDALSDAQLQVQELEKEACKNFVLFRHSRQGAIGCHDLITSTNCDRCFASERLMPIYLGTYRYKGKSYEFIISGITGDCFGDYPHSKLISTLRSFQGLGRFLVTILALIALLWFLNIRQEELKYSRTSF